MKSEEITKVNIIHSVVNPSNSWRDILQIWTFWWYKRKSQRTKVINTLPLNMCTKLYGNPYDNWRVQSRAKWWTLCTTDQPTDRPIHNLWKTCNNYCISKGINGCCSVLTRAKISDFKTLFPVCTVFCMSLDSHWSFHKLPKSRIN